MALTLVALLLAVGLSIGLSGCSSGTSTATGGGGSTGPSGSSHASIGRTKYMRTDAVTEAGFDINSRWIVYHAATNRFFVSDPDSNQIMVLDAATEKQIGAITVPGAYGIDLTPDGATLYAGTVIGDVYAIDPVKMAVTHRYVASAIGSNGFPSLAVFVLADGRLALLGSAGGIPSVDGSDLFAIWDPVTNALSAYATPSGISVTGILGWKIPLTPICSPLENIAAFTVSGDRTTVLLGSADSDGTICAFNPTTQQVVTTKAEGLGADVFNLVSTPDGTAVLEPQGSQIAVLDAKTLALERNIAVVPPLSTTSVAVSPDSSTMYINEGSAIYAYNIATGAQLGWMPGLTVPALGAGLVVGATPVIQAFDQTGLMAGPTEEGVGFIDTKALQTGKVGTLFSYGYITPATGPAAGGTSTSIDTANSPVPVEVDFGTSASPSATGQLGGIQAVTPAHAAGPVDVTAYTSDGGALILPEAFSYGPTVLEVTPNFSTADGGGTGWVYGYGFGSTASKGTPTGLQVTVGGTPVTVQTFQPYAYTSTPPFPLQAFSYTIPAGISGSTAPVTITTPSGSTTQTTGVQYLPAIHQFPLAGANLAQGVYDAKRSRYYFTNANEIEVFSPTLGGWQAPIAVPPAVGTTHRLWGIALSPDGSLLAVSDPNTEMIYLLNPDTGAAQSFAVQKPVPGVLYLPAGLAVSDAGMVYFTLADDGGTGYHGYFKLNTATGSFLDYKVANPGHSYADLQLRAQITSDNSTVLFNDDGQIIAVNTATDLLARVRGVCCYGTYDITLAAGQERYAASGYSFDSASNEESDAALNDREALNISYVNGEKMSADGTLLFQPSTNGIDVYDGRLGTLRARIALPVALSQNFDALVTDGTDNVLIGITGSAGSGIAVIDLSSLSEPAALPYAHSGESSALSSQMLPSKPGLAVRSHAAVPHVINPQGARAQQK